MSIISRRVTAKLAQWERAAVINACRAIQVGRSAILVVYPTGKQMMRFAEPFTDYGMHYEVSPQVWEQLQTDPHVYF